MSLLRQDVLSCRFYLLSSAIHVFIDIKTIFSSERHWFHDRLSYCEYQTWSRGFGILAYLTAALEYNLDICVEHDMVVAKRVAAV
jgi:hypothetical protein